MHMESGDLKIFRAVAQEGSITKAASRLGYVQSNVTARIRQLEAELNAPLLYRQSRGVLLTPAGQNLLIYADKIVHLLEEAVKSTRNSETPSGPLRIGSLETNAAVYLPGIMLEYHRNYPEVKLSLHTAQTSELIQNVLDYELDAAFVGGSVDHPDLEVLLSFEEELVLIAEPNEISLEGALSKPQLFFGKGCSHRQKLEQWLHEEHQEPLNVMEFGTLEAILGGVSAGLGVSLLTHASVKTWEEAGKIRCFRVPERFRYSVVSFIYRRDLFRTSAFNKFAEQLLRSPHLVRKEKT
ncbi:LysR family transcriptional regulator YofA [Paenibacillus azoreducens]|uniref:HTH-type transcriptional regulator YofA n=2 Tax=Paenibacillus azoreducens TaxID=116718 RepID=A0A919YFW4_9BACL|nr:HTH-type transcriptional regulator YofA [Paenibacillus azoreducens]